MQFDWIEEPWVSEKVRLAFEQVPFERMTRESNGVPIRQTTAPSMMARMLSGLEVEPDLKVLEIGTGSGYNAALLQELTGPMGRVITVEVDPAVSTAAQKRLQENGYGSVRCVGADGWHGWEEDAPYDRIIAACKPASLPEAWAQQLREGGLLVTPLAKREKPEETVIVYFRKQEGELKQVEEHGGGFIPMTRI